MGAKRKNRRPGAGFVVLQKRGDQICVLGLAQKGSLDLPKGVKEDDEDWLTCAFRECQEEAGLDDVVVIHPEHFQIGTLRLFLATSLGTPHIEPNPETGIVEHSGFEWIPINIAAPFFKGFLGEAIKWAQSCLGDEEIKNKIAEI